MEGSGVLGYVAVFVVSVVAFVFGGFSPRWMESYAARTLRLLKFFRKKEHFHYHQITENVYLGRLPYTYEHLGNLKEIGVVAMVSVVEPWEMPFRITDIQNNYGIEVLLLPTPDYFSPTVQQIDEGLKFIEQHSKKGSVYLHCHAGKGRSAIVMIAYLCVKNGWSLAESFRYVRSKRPIANLPLFYGIRPQWRALLAWDTSYQNLLLQSKSLR